MYYSVPLNPIEYIIYIYIIFIYLFVYLFIYLS
jgi:hypothetical protein